MNEPTDPVFICPDCGGRARPLSALGTIICVADNACAWSGNEAVLKGATINLAGKTLKISVGHDHGLPGENACTVVIGTDVETGIQYVFQF